MGCQVARSNDSTHQRRVEVHKTGDPSHSGRVPWSRLMVRYYRKNYRKNYLNHPETRFLSSLKPFVWLVWSLGMKGPALLVLFCELDHNFLVYWTLRLPRQPCSVLFCSGLFYSIFSFSPHYVVGWHFKSLLCCWACSSSLDTRWQAKRQEQRQGQEPRKAWLPSVCHWKWALDDLHGLDLCCIASKIKTMGCPGWVWAPRATRLFRPMNPYDLSVFIDILCLMGVHALAPLPCLMTWGWLGICSHDGDCPLTMMGWSSSSCLACRST